MSDTSSPIARQVYGLPETQEPTRPLGADGQPISAPDPGIVSSEEMDRRRTAEAFDHLESKGFPARGTPEGDDLHNMLGGTTTVTPELQKQAENKLAMMERDADWRRRFFDGDARAIREFHLATGIIAAGKAQRPQ